MGSDSHAAEAALKSSWQDDGNIPEMYRPIERFVCNIYSERSGLDTLSALRWEVFRQKNLEGENFLQLMEHYYRILFGLTICQ